MNTSLTISHRGGKCKCVNARTLSPEPRQENERRNNHTLSDCDCERLGLDPCIFLVDDDLSADMLGESQDSVSSGLRYIDLMNEAYRV